MRVVKGFFLFWWDFIVGEDWKIAAGVAGILSAGGFLVAYTGLSDTAISFLIGASVVVVVSLSIIGDTISARRR
jgi:hypothetical protein